jgi:hypothetical protein
MVLPRARWRTTDQLKLTSWRQTHLQVRTSQVCRRRSSRRSSRRSCRRSSRRSSRRSRQPLRVLAAAPPDFRAFCVRHGPALAVPPETAHRGCVHVYRGRRLRRPLHPMDAGRWPRVKRRRLQVCGRACLGRSWATRLDAATTSPSRAHRHYLECRRSRLPCGGTTRGETTRRRPS